MSNAGEETPRGATGTTATKVSVFVGIVSAMVLGVLVNVLVARHYARWDWTQAGLYTLSDATIETLRSLEEPIHIDVLLSSDDPLSISVHHLLDAYGAETSRLDVEYVDPDTNVAQFLALQQRYRINTLNQDGRVVLDAAIIVSRGDTPHFITTRDLVEVDDEDDLKARPRLEQALTAGIRSVLRGDKPRVCFTTGHGERLVDEQLAPLKDRLLKNNYEVVPLAVGARAGDVELGSCRLVILAGPNTRVPDEQVALLRKYVDRGGNVLVVAGLEPEGDEERYVRLGLDDLLALMGVKLVDDFIIERDPERRATAGVGETFFPKLAPHSITQGLLRAAEKGQAPAVIMTVGSSLATVPGAAVAPAPLLVTSDQAFGMVDFFAWAKQPTAHPEPAPSDHMGPLTVAYAAELPKGKNTDAPHGPRLAVISSVSVLHGENWRNPELRGTAQFVESTIAWLAANPVHLDIPSKPLAMAGLALTEDARQTILFRVVIAIPLAALLLGLAVYFWRTSTERRTKAERAPE